MQLNLFAAVSTGKAGPPTAGEDANVTTEDAASAASEVFAGLLAGLGVAKTATPANPLAETTTASASTSESTVSSGVASFTVPGASETLLSVESPEAGTGSGPEVQVTGKPKPLIVAAWPPPQVSPEGRPLPGAPLVSTENSMPSRIPLPATVVSAAPTSVTMPTASGIVAAVTESGAPDAMRYGVEGKPQAAIGLGTAATSSVPPPLPGRPADTGIPAGYGLGSQPSRKLTLTSPKPAPLSTGPAEPVSSNPPLQESAPAGEATSEVNTAAAKTASLASVETPPPTPESIVLPETVAAARPAELTVDPIVTKLGSELPDTNTTTRTAPESIRAQVTRQLAASALGKNGDEAFTLRLEPEQLGKVEVRVVVSGDRLEVIFTADSADAERALREGARELVTTLTGRSDGRWQAVDVRVTEQNVANRGDDDASDHDEETSDGDATDGDNSRDAHVDDQQRDDHEETEGEA